MSYQARRKKRKGADGTGNQKGEPGRTTGDRPEEPGQPPALHNLPGIGLTQSFCWQRGYPLFPEELRRNPPALVGGRTELPQATWISFCFLGNGTSALGGLFPLKNELG